MAEVKTVYIQNIEGLYPIDSDYPKTNEIGSKLLQAAMVETGFDWRTLPVEVLRVYSQKCEAMSNKAERDFMNACKLS